MPKKLTNEEFIRKSKIKHPNKDTYEKTVYKNSIEKVIITCKIHGNYKIKPNSYLNGRRCYECGTIKKSLIMRKTTLEFIKEHRKLHNNQDTYKKTIYQTSHIKLIITCKKHGDYEIMPYSALNGRRCYECGVDNIILKNTIPSKQYFNDCNIIHENKYTYDKSIYLGMKHKIEIGCKIHGYFWQKAQMHISGRGCQKCACEKNGLNQTLLKSDIIERLDNMGIKNYKIPNKWGGINTKIGLSCKKHGSYNMKYHDIKKGSSCPKCRGSKGEKIMSEILCKNKIKHTEQHRFLDCRNINPLPFDFYLPEYSICIEYDGEQHFKPKPFWGGYEGLKKVKRNDRIKTKYCKNNNITLIRIKYTQINNIEKILKKCNIIK